MNQLDTWTVGILTRKGWWIGVIDVPTELPFPELWSSGSSLFHSVSEEPNKKDYVIKIVAVDFDDTLSTGHWDPDVNKCTYEFNKTAIEILRQFQSRGGKVIIWTCRTGDHRVHAIQALRMRGGFTPDFVNMDTREIEDQFGTHGRECQKVYADLYIDDRNTIDRQVDWEQVREWLRRTGPVKDKEPELSRYEKGIKQASQWAQALASTGKKGYGVDGTMDFVQEYLHMANNWIGELMEHPNLIDKDLTKAVSRLSKKNQIKSLKWMPTLVQWAKDKGIWRNTNEGLKEGYIGIIRTNGIMNLAIIYDGNGGAWGNSASRKKVHHYENVLKSFADLLIGWVSTDPADLKGDDTLLVPSLSITEGGEVLMSEPNNVVSLPDCQVTKFEVKESMMEKAKRYVLEYHNTKLDRSTNSDAKISIGDVFIVWFCKTLGNWKALASTTVNDGMYYEVTYNGEQQETYVDCYRCVDHVLVPDSINHISKVVYILTITDGASTIKRAFSSRQTAEKNAERYRKESTTVKCTIDELEMH